MGSSTLHLVHASEISRTKEGNAVELIVAIIALIQGQIRIVKAELLGSMLSTLLLLLGMSFFFGGVKHKEQIFNIKVKRWKAKLIQGCSNGFIAIRASNLIVTNPCCLPNRGRDHCCLCGRGFANQSRNIFRFTCDIWNVLPTCPFLSLNIIGISISNSERIRTYTMRYSTKKLNRKLRFMI